MRPPDMEGTGVRAWSMTHRIGELADGDLQRQCGIAGWLMQVPWAHPFWSWYGVSVVNLRDVPGYPPAAKQYPEARYELMVAALDPGHCADLDPDTTRGLVLLSPLDHSIQFHGVTDEQAARVGEQMVRNVTRGLSPDQDFRCTWWLLVGEIVERMRKEA